MHPDLKSRDESSLQLSRARELLSRILAADSRAGVTDDDLVEAARLFDRDFEILVRLLRALVRRMHHARVLGKPQSTFRPGGATASSQRNLSGAA